MSAAPPRRGPGQHASRLPAAAVAAASHAPGVGATRHAIRARRALLERAGDLRELAPLRDGSATVQDEAAIMVGHALGPLPGETVADVCAAPGTKTTHLAALMANRGRIVAADPHAAGCDLLRDGVRAARGHDRRVAAGRRARARRRRSGRRATASWSTRRARTSASFGATPTPSGAAGPTTSRRWSPRSARSSTAAADAGPAGRGPRLRDLLPRARGERGGRGRRSGRAGRTSCRTLCRPPFPPRAARRPTSSG